MKKNLRNHLKNLLFAISGLLFLFSQQAKGGEFVILNKDVTWAANAQGAYSPFQTDLSMPDNWLSPDDYFHGTIYTRYEIISVATNAPVGMQFCMFQWQPDAIQKTSVGALCESVRWLSGGAGSVIISGSSPASWFSENGGVDFSRIPDIQSLSPAIWCNDPVWPIGKPGEGGDAAGIAWSKRYNWFPITLRVTIVAVSDGSTFSGWANYIGGAPLTQQPTPNYGIDYGFEMTTRAVAPTDEYSYSADMSGAVSGNLLKLSLTPGRDVYFRTKAGGGLAASDIQHLVVPGRPATPMVSIDYNSEKTLQLIGTGILYSTSPSHTDPVAGSNDYISLTPGQDLYLWVKATGNAFGSLYTHLVVPYRPAAPDYQINFATVKTVQAVLPGDEYSTQADMSGAVNGTNVTIDLTPGTDLYFRTKYTASSFGSDIQHLIVNPRPESPLFHIDYEHEATSEIIGTTVEYSASSDLSGALTGTGTLLHLTPGQNEYFRIKATDSTFNSTAYLLEVPVRPVLVYSGKDTITTETFTLSAILDAGMTGFSLSDVSVTNGVAQNLHGNNIFNVTADAVGEVHVIIPFNSFNGASFGSNEIVVYYKNVIVTGIQDITKNAFSVYPNPSSDGMVFIHNKLMKSFTADVLSVDGSIVRTLVSNGSEKQQISLQDLKKGVYFLRINSEGNCTMHKLILE